MKIRHLSPLLVAGFAVCAAPSVAQQIINGANPTPLSPTGVTGGVEMTGQGGGGTLIVGTIGGPEMDIFTNNSAGGIVTNPLLEAVSTDASSLSNIVFNSSSNVYGAIGVTQPGGPFFLDINGGNNGTVVKFMGNVFATITTVSGTGSLDFDSGSTNISATNFAADGTISLAPNTTLIGALTTSTTDTGTLVLGGGSVLTGAVGGATGLKAINVVGGSNTAGISASINGAVDAYSFNLGTNTLNIAGALTIANTGAGGVVDTTLASPTVYGNIRATGATNLGPTIAVDVTVPSTAFLPVGTIFDIVQTTAGTVQSGTNGSIVTVIRDPTNPLYTFTAVPPAGTIAGLVAIEVTGIPLTAPVAPPPGVPLPPVAPIVLPIVPILVGAGTVAPPASDLVMNVLPAINALTSVQAVVNALAQLAPSTPDLSAAQVTFEGAREFQNVWSAHLDQSLCGLSDDDLNRPDRENATCTLNNPQSGWWADGFGYFGNQGEKGAFLGYDSSIFGGMVGFDIPLDDDTHAGLGAGYSKSIIDGKVFRAETDFDTYQGTAYIAHESGAWFVSGDASFGWNSYSGTRQILFPGIDRTADAKYDGDDITGFVSTGYHFFTGGFSITPLASLQYSDLSLDSYTETGAGDIDLRVRSQNYNFLESGLGVKVGHPYDIGDGANLLPEIHFRWLYDIDDPTPRYTATFTAVGATPFVTPGLGQAHNTFDAGTGFNLASCTCSGGNWTASAVYDYYWASNAYFANQVMFKFSDRF